MRYCTPLYIVRYVLYQQDSWGTVCTSRQKWNQSTIASLCRPVAARTVSWGASISHHQTSSTIFRRDSRQEVRPRRSYGRKAESEIRAKSTWLAHPEHPF